jgi:type I restriction enzyme S subunit
MRTMKDSGVEWLGEIPSTWMVSKFRYAFREGKEVNGTTPVGEMLSVSGYKGVVPKVYEEESLKRDADQLETYRVVRKGQLAVNTMWLNHGGLGVSELEGHMSPAYRAYWINNKIYPRYAHHLLRSQLYISGYTSYLTGVRPNSLQMSRDNLMNFAVLLPPLEEQRGIVEYVEAEAPQIDTLISKKEQLIEKLLERRQALITQVVTKGLDPNVPMKDSGVKWLGEVPEGWTVAPLKTVVNLNPESLGESTDSSLIINYIEIGDVAPPAGVNGYKPCAFGDSPSRARRLVQPGDVLISTVRTYLKAIGRVPARANDDPWVASTGFAALRPTRVNSRFLELALSADSFISRIQANSVGVSYPGIDASKLVRFQLAVPPEREQAKIAAYLDKETSQIDSLVEKTRRAIELLKERRQALITQVVTGKIDVRGFAGGNS